ncbi:MAG: hypothetical protein IJ728_06510 [Selenomonadaceae bacterium]|nr:hypothetical protein [Selenomonadaceae bacterium]
MLNKIFEWILGVLPIFILIFFVVIVYNDCYDVALGFILGLAVMPLRNYLERRKNNKHRLNIDNLH